MEKICPVVAAINEIQGAGLLDEEDSRIVNIVGADEPIIHDEMSFYITKRKLDFARFELSKPNADECRIKYDKMFRDIAGRNYEQVYIYLLLQLDSRYIAEQFAKIFDIIIYTGQLIAQKIIIHPTANISIGAEPYIPQNIYSIIMRPTALTICINQICRYISSLNIASIIGPDIDQNIPQLAPFKKSFDLNRSIINTDMTDKSADQCLDIIRDMLSQELEIARYVRDIELYQCDALNHLYRAYAICEKIVTRLSKC